MVSSLRTTLVVGSCLLACSQTTPEQGAAARNSGESAGGTAPGSTGNTPGVGGGGSSGLTGVGGLSGGMGSGAAEGTASGGASLTPSANTTGTGGDGTAGNATSTPGAGGAGGSDGGVTEAGATDRGGMPEPGGLTSFTLAVIGSSTAAGEGASSSSRGWVSLLASELEERVVGDFVAKNLSVGGYSTSSLVPGSSSNGNIDDAIDEAPNLIIVALAGSNDLSNGVSTETFLSRLATIRDTAVEAGIPVFFVSTAPKDLSSDEQHALLDWTDQMRQEFGTCWTPPATSYSPCFIDIFEALANSSLGIADEYGSGDGIHLNDAGHLRIFEIADGIVQPYVCSVTECTE